MRMIKKCIALSVLTALTACGGGGSSSPAEPQGFDMSGRAVKGVFKNADITATDINGLVATATTDAEGKFDLELPAGFNGSLKIVLTAKADGSTTMTCDLANGCLVNTPSGSEQIAFGEDIALPGDSDFSLSAVIARVNAENQVQANITTLTDLAARLAEARGELNPVTIDYANSQVAALFSIEGDITQLLPVDITDIQELIEASANEQEAAIIAAAIIDALSRAQDSNFIDEYNEFAEAFLQQDGQLIINGSDENAASLERIFAASVAIAQLIESLSEEDIVEDNLASELTTQQTEATTATEDELTAAEGSSESGETELSKAKAMIADLYELQNDLGGLAANFENTSSQSIMQFSTTVSNTVVPELTPLFAAFNETANAYFEDPTLTSYSVNGYNVQIEKGHNNYSVVLKVQQDTPSPSLFVVDVTAEITADISFSFNYQLDVSGSLTSPQLSAHLTQGNVQLNSATPTSENSLRIAGISTELDVSIEQFESVGVEPLEFSGQLNLAVNDIKQAYVETPDYMAGEAGFRSAMLFSYGTANIALTGEFSDQYHQLTAEVTANSKANGFGFVVTSDSEQSYIAKGCNIQLDYSVNCTKPETESDHITLSLALNSQLEAQGLGSGELNARIARTGLASGDVNLELAWNENKFDLIYNSPNLLPFIQNMMSDEAVEMPPLGTAIISDKNGVELRLPELTTLAGSIQVNGVEYGRINENQIVKFLDGTTLTLQ